MGKHEHRSAGQVEAEATANANASDSATDDQTSVVASVGNDNTPKASSSK